MVELESWGWNLMTLGFLGTVALTLVRVWGYVHQWRRIWTERSVRSLSAPAFVYQAGASTCAVAYGASIGSLAMVLNGTVSLMLFTPVLVGISRFRGFRRAESLIAAMLAGLLIALLATSEKDFMYLLVMSGLMVTTWLVPLEILRNKDAGVVELRMIIASTLNSAFWLLYATAIGNWVLETINPVFLVSNVLTSVLWFRYRRRPARRTVAA